MRKRKDPVISGNLYEENVADIKADGRSEGLPYKEGMGDVKDSLREGACGGSWLEDRQH